MIRTATLCAIALMMTSSVSLSAQSKPATPTPEVSVTGCVAQAQRDGSTGQKATGTTASPETAATEANNPEPTNRYLLTDATPVAKAAAPAGGETPAGTADRKTSYALRGQEKELATHAGHRVQITGTLLPPLEAKLPEKAAATAEGIRAVQVSSIKMIGTDCSAGASK